MNAAAKDIPRPLGADAPVFAVVKVAGWLLRGPRILESAGINSGDTILSAARADLGPISPLLAPGPEGGLFETIPLGSCVEVEVPVAAACALSIAEVGTLATMERVSGTFMGGGVLVLVDELEL